MREVQAALLEGERRLCSSSPTARLDSELLLAHLFGVSREKVVRLAVGLEEPLSLPPRWRASFRALLARRAAGEPVAYLVGERCFRTVTVRSDRRALVPRPESELLVELAVRELPEGVTVADLGTGSGVLALALKAERPDLTVYGTDLSLPALALARENAQRLGLAVAFRRADLLEGLGQTPFALLANLPYLPSGEPRPPALAYEPALALTGGFDGLAVIRRLIAQLAGQRGARFVALEVGAGQAVRVAALLKRVGYRKPWVVQDLAGLPRVVAGWRGG